MTTVASPALEQQLSRNPGKTGVIVFGSALIGGLIYTINALAKDLGSVSTTSIFPYLLLGIALLTAGIRIREWIPRYSQRRGDGDIHPFDGSPCRRRLVGDMELHWCPGLDRRGRLRHHFSSSGRTDSSGGQPGRICDGLRTAHRRDHLEHWNLVPWPSRVEFAHHGRFDYRCGHCEPADVDADKHQRRRLRPGTERGEIAADFSSHGIPHSRKPASNVQSRDQRQKPL